MTRTERRLAERFGLKIPLRVRIAKPTALEHTAESLNVSTRGICFATDLPLRKGTPVHLVFEMPEEVTHKPTSEWLCTGHVVHVRPNSSPQSTTCVGVRFDCYEVLRPVSQLDGSMIGRNATPQRNH
jgi:PilZ domain